MCWADQKTNAQWAVSERAQTAIVSSVVRRIEPRNRSATPGWTPPAVARATRSLFNLLSPQQVEQIRHLGRDPELEARVSYLAEQANEGKLTAAEEAEYLGYVEANSVLAVLQSAARQQPPAH